MIGNNSKGPGSKKTKGPILDSKKTKGPILGSKKTKGPMLDSQNLGAREPKGLYWIAKIGLGHR